LSASRYKRQLGSRVIILVIPVKTTTEAMLCTRTYSHNRRHERQRWGNYSLPNQLVNSLTANF